MGQSKERIQKRGYDQSFGAEVHRPLIDPEIVGEALAEFLKTRTTPLYVGNSDPHRSESAGLDVQEVSA